MVHFVLTILFVLTLDSEIAVINGDDAFSILIFSTRKRYSDFLKKVFGLKVCFKIKVLKIFKVSTDCHIKTCQSLKRSAILKISTIIFRRTYALSVHFKIIPLKKAISSVKTKPTKIFPQDLLKGATTHFYCLFDEPSFSSMYFWYVVMECIELKGTLMQTWKSADIFVFIWKCHVEDFILKHRLRSKICAREMCKKFVYKHSATIEYVKN